MEGYSPLGGVLVGAGGGRAVVGHGLLQFGGTALGLEGLGPVDQRRGSDPAGLGIGRTNQDVDGLAQRLEGRVRPAGLGQGQAQVHQGRGPLPGRRPVSDQVGGLLEEGRRLVGPSQPTVAVAGRGADAGVLHRGPGLGKNPAGPLQQLQGAVKVAGRGLAAGHRHPIGGQRPPVGVAPGPDPSQIRLKPLQTHRLKPPTRSDLPLLSKFF